MKYFRCLTLLCLLGLGLFSTPWPTRADAADTWWDDAWPYRIPVTVSGTGVAEVSINFTAAFNTLGLNFSINTDDPGSFENSMVSEYALLADTFDFDAGDFMRIYENTLAARFTV